MSQHASRSFKAEIHELNTEALGYLKIGEYKDAADLYEKVLEMARVANGAAPCWAVSGRA